MLQTAVQLIAEPSRKADFTVCSTVLLTIDYSRDSRLTSCDLLHVLRAPYRNAFCMHEQ